MLKKNYIKIARLVLKNYQYCNILDKLNKIIVFLSVVSILSFFPSVTTLALTQTTAEKIHGTEPYLVGENGVIPADLNDVLNFYIIDDKGNKKIYYGNSVLPEGTLTTGFPENMKISDFKIMDWDGFRDDDGDEVALITGYTYSWKDKFDREVKSDELLDPCRAPYKLEIIAENLQLTTKYGIPISKTYENPGLSKTFSIDVQYHTPICYVKPLNMDTNDKNVTDGGHTADFLPDAGFKTSTIASQGRIWPTTAFGGAVFLLLTRDLDKTNDHYTFSVTKGGDVLQVRNGNEFIFRPNLWEDYDPYYNVKPPYQYTIEAKNKYTNEVYEYSFEIEKWAKPDGVYGLWTFDEVKGNCDIVHGSLFSAAELTNSDYNIGPNARFTRALDGTLQGEWGRLPAYENSAWLFGPGKKDKGYYWTSDWTEVFIDNGAQISDRKPKHKYYQVCKIMAK